MLTFEAIINRRSRRTFLAKTIERDAILKLIDAGRLAPTARNVQPWEFVVVSNSKTLNHIAELAENGRFISDCSSCIAVFCQDTKYYLEDGCAATENILIAAEGLGLAACWVAGDKKPYCENVREVLGVPAGYKLVSLIALGFSEGPPAQTPPKRASKEVLHWEKW
ncbi:MAG: nitroreductase family protein [Candidatus Omnitrophica bacterium]|nr:nitroreductase family protein [Candidatus Omnitrophota bacterium]